jgi:hypothetical protein
MQGDPPGHWAPDASADGYMDTVDVRGTPAEGTVPAEEIDLWQMRRWATGAYEIGWYRNGLWQRRVDALAQRDREAAWQARLDALDQLHGRFTRLSTLRGFNDMGLHGRRSRPLYALTIRLTDEADQLEAERPGWSWPGYAYVLGWLNLVARQRIEDVDIVAVALGHFDRQPR